MTEPVKPLYTSLFSGLKAEKFDLENLTKCLKYVLESIYKKWKF